MSNCAVDGDIIDEESTYTSHEETESSTKTETHGAGDDGLDRTRFHTSLHLLRVC
jgi:hypothetical protein